MTRMIIIDDKIHHNFTMNIRFYQINNWKYFPKCEFFFTDLDLFILFDNILTLIIIIDVN